MVKIVTSPGSSILPSGEKVECSSSHEMNTVPDEHKGGRNTKHSQVKENKKDKLHGRGRSETTADMRETIDVIYSDEEKDEDSYILDAAGASSISSSILNEPSNFVVSHLDCIYR